MNTFINIFLIILVFINIYFFIYVINSRNEMTKINVTKITQICIHIQNLLKFIIFITSNICNKFRRQSR